MGSIIGAWRIAAKKIGVSVERYVSLRDSGMKWCGAHRQWEPRSAFLVDRSRRDGLYQSCRDGRNAASRRRYRDARARALPPKPPPQRSGILARSVEGGTTRASFR